MENLDQKISTVPEVKPQVIDASLFFPLGKKKATQLINNSDETFTYDLKEDECLLKLKHPLFISTVKVYGKDVETKLKLQTIELNGDKSSIESVETEDEYIEFSINKIITEIILLPVKGFFKGSSVKLTKISFIGFPLDQAKAIASSIEAYLTLREEIRGELLSGSAQIREERQVLDKEKKSFSDNINTLNEQVSQKKKEEKQFQDKIDSLTKEYSKQESHNKVLDEEVRKKNETLQALRAKEEELNAKKKTVEDAIEQNNRKNSSLNNDIADNEKKLKELISNKNLFSEELSTYNEASEDDVKYHTRWAIGAGILFALIGLTCFVFLSILAFNGTGTWKDVWLTRIPLSAFTIFILKGLYSFMRSKLDKATELKDKKKNLIAIGVIAKEITEQLSEELQLSNEEKFKYKFNEKIEMIKKLLLSVSGTDSEFKSSKLKVLIDYVESKKNDKIQNAFIHQKTNEQENQQLKQ